MTGLRSLAFFSLALAVSAGAAFAGQQTTQNPAAPAGVTTQQQAAAQNASQNLVAQKNEAAALSQNNGTSAEERTAAKALPSFKVFDNTSASEQGQGAYMEVSKSGDLLFFRRVNGNHTRVWCYNLTTDVITFTSTTPGRTHHEHYAPGDKGYKQALNLSQNLTTDHLLHAKIITTPSSRNHLRTVQSFMNARLAELK